MKNIFRNNVKRTIAILLLGLFVLSFLHSELGFLDFDGDNHGAHDYCEIVKNTNVPTKVFREELPKLEYNKDICIHCFEEIEMQATQACFQMADQHILDKYSTEVNLFNKTFLI